MTEKRIMQEIQIAMSGEDARLFRNQVGAAELKDGSYIKFGLGTGSSDLIGFKIVTMTPSDIGRKVAIFTAIEVKAGKGRTTKEQDNFIRVIRESGGIAFVARSKEEAVENINRRRDT